MRRDDGREELTGLSREQGLGFDQPVPPGGYRWWYVDGISTCGRHSLTIIAFIGSVFSPFYFRARQKGEADPRDFICLNVALTGDRPNRWCFTERDRRSLVQASDRLTLGASALHWDGESLVIDIAETSCPLPRPVKGRVTVTPSAVAEVPFALDAEARHLWQPIGPSSRISVEMEKPALRWTGEAYFDSNWGTRPLEDDFDSWTWSRTPTPHGVQIFYDLSRRDGSEHNIAVCIGRSGAVEDIAAPDFQSLPHGLWGIARIARSENQGKAELLDTLLDAPFYARSVVETYLGGAKRTGTHESVSLERFGSPWVQMLLPFKSDRRV